MLSCVSYLFYTYVGIALVYSINLHNFVTYASRITCAPFELSLRDVALQQYDPLDSETTINSSGTPAQFPKHIPVGLPGYLLSCFLEILHQVSTSVRPAGFCDQSAAG